MTNVASYGNVSGDSVMAQSVGLPPGIRACLFDLDGVLVQTASLHAAAWEETFNGFLRKRCRRTGEPYVPFDRSLDYDRYVDGRERYDGVRSFLAARGVAVDEATIKSLGDLKNERVLDLIRRHGIEAYEESARYVRAVRAAGLRRAVVSGSANCRAALEKSNLSDLFEVRIDAAYTAAKNLPGKPGPDAFLAAARELGVAPVEAAVFEDALAGVVAGCAGGFGFVVGVGRTGRGADLRRAGADVVVSHLTNLLERG